MNLKKILFRICLTLSFAKHSQGTNDDEEELVGDDGEDDLNISVNNNNANNLMKCIFFKTKFVSIVPPLHLKELISEFSEHEFIIKEVTTKTGKNSETKKFTVIL